MTKISGRHQKQTYVYFRALPPHPLHGKNPLCWLPFVFVWFCDTVKKLKLRHWWKILTFRDGQWRALAIFLEICFFGNPLEYCRYQWKRFCHIIRVAKTPSARQQCWPESFCKSGKFLRQVHYWLTNFRILCNTKYPDNMQSVRMNWKVSGQSKKFPDNLENVSG